MGITSETVEVRPTGKMIQYYKAKGYDAKHQQPLIVQVNDLPNGSNIQVEVVCDYCGEKCNPRYVEYINSIKIDGTYACTHCAIHKAEKTMYNKYGVLNYSSTQECREKVTSTLMSKYGISHISESEEFLKQKCENNKNKYGVEHTLQVQEFREKGIQTMKNKYGVEHGLQNEEIKEHMKNTVEQRYGVPYAVQNPEIMDKVFCTNLEKYGYRSVLSSPEIREKISNTIKNVYGVEYISQSDEIKEKKAETTLLHYGITHPSLSEEIVEKRMKTFYKNGTTPTSKQQKYIFNLYRLTDESVQLNFPISHFNADICFPEEKIDIEYDGGFHNGQVKLGRITQEEFDRKELIRNQVIKKEGYKQMRIVSRKDFLPSDAILLQMLNDAREYFSTTSHSWITYDLDFSTVRNAEHKNGTKYEYGELRKISGDEETLEETLEETIEETESILETA